MAKVFCPYLRKIGENRNPYQQSVKCKAIKDAQTGDQGGHLIGSQFDGPGEQINLVPMKSTINQSPGSYYQMEQEWATIKANGGTVTNVKIKVIYGTDNRPIRFEVSSDINVVDTEWLHSNL